jgi:putative SOS response-associated peptidase YedK
MPVDEAPDDDDVRETYNFAPGSIGAIYRADLPSRDTEAQHEKEPIDSTNATESAEEEASPSATHYKLQGMKWGLVPFWTQRQPDYGSLMRTINCRDDSLIDDRGMWTSMKRKKRCVVVCQGYYEWLKRGPGGKDKIPHYTRRKDGDLMYFAGLWDCVKYQGKFTVVKGALWTSD